MSNKVYTSTDQLDIQLDDIPSMPPPRRVMLVRPTHFDVEYVINPHMANQIGAVDTIQAENEWLHIYDAFEELGLDVVLLEGKEGLPDMVFCANQSLPYIDQDGNKKVIMSVMHADERKDEVPYIEQWFRRDGYEILHLQSLEDGSFEGMGDAIWHFRKELLWGGYGFRTSLNAYQEISNLLNLPIMALKLTDERFYHLDTCLSALNEKCALIYPAAFDDKGLELIHAHFEHVIEATNYEAEKLLAVNAACPDGKNVFIQQGCTDVNKKLRDHGFHVHEFSTYEFLKSGGSVYCMKLMLW